MDETGQKKMNECLDYFRQRSVYEKLFQKFKEKYASLGHMGGKAVLSGLTLAEKQDLSGFLQKDYTENKTVTVSAGLLEKCLAESRFSGISGEMLLEAYFGEKLTVKKEEKEKEEKKRKDFFAGLLNGKEEDPVGMWLKEVLEKHSNGYEILMQQYRENPEGLRDILKNIMKAYQQICIIRKKQLLAVFAAQVTGNPHYFDAGKTAERLLILFLKDQFKSSFSDEMSPAEEKSCLLYQAGILKDDLSNETLAYGLHAWKQDGCIHKGIEGFLKEKEPVRLTLRTLGELGKVTAQKREVYVVENPAVFSILTSRNPSCAAVCINGQPRLAGLMVLDLFAKSGIRIYYAGDLDPEGLLIAQKLSQYYKGEFHYWHMETADYEKCRSEEVISPKRMKILERITDGRLKPVVDRIEEYGTAGYQEMLVEEM